MSYWSLYPTLWDPFRTSDKDMLSESTEGNIRKKDQDRMKSYKCPHCGLRIDPAIVIHESEPEPKICMSCGFRWKSKKEDPKRCPECGSYRWNSKATKCKCSKCGYSWIPRVSVGTPLRCPKCQSSKWMEKSKKKKNSSKKGNAKKRAVPSPKLSKVAGLEEAIKRCAKGEGCTKVALDTGLPFFLIARSMVQTNGKYKI